MSDLFGLLGILVGLGILIWLAFRSWSVLLARAAGGGRGGAVLARAHPGALDADLHARFFAQFFPLFPPGAVFGKLTEDNQK